MTNNTSAKATFGCFIVGLVFGIWIAQEIAMTYYRSKAIENGAAFYHQTTGRFKWKNAE